MKSNIIMQSNNGKHRERTISSVLFDARTLILTLVITMTMVMGTAFFTNTAQAVSGSGATVRVATFDQLNDALGNGGVSDIIIDPQAAEEFADNEGTEISFDGSDVFYIPIEYPLVVSHDVTITSEAAVNFARSGNGGGGKYDSKAFKGQNEVTPALFNVDQGKTLVLEGDIAMTGEEVSATFDSAQGSFLFTVKARDNLDDEDDEDDNDAWSYGSDPGKLSTGGYFIYTKGGNVVMNNGILLMGLNTKDNVKDIAPVYIDGTAKAATLTVDGAEIVDNNLGQTEDGNSTAGAVILKGENATAALNSGAISNNNADVAGIIVKEEAELELGNDFGINDGDIYDEKAEEAAKEEAAQEETKEETPEEAPIVAPKKSLKSFKAPATQMRSAGNVISDQAKDLGGGNWEVSSWKQLKKLLNDTSKTINTITITKDIIATPLEGETSQEDKSAYLRGRTVTIRGPETGDPVHIYRDKDDADFPLFVVQNSNNKLTLGENLILSGKVGEYVEDGNGSGNSTDLTDYEHKVYICKPRSDDNSYLTTDPVDGGANALGYESSMYSISCKIVNGRLYMLDDSNNYNWQLYSNVVDDFRYRYTVENNGSGTLLEVHSDTNGTLAASSAPGGKYYLYDPLNKKYLTKYSDSGYKYFVPADNKSDATEFYVGTQLGNPVATVWIINGTVYYTSGEAEAALPKEKRLVVTDRTWTDDDFTSGASINDPSAFFVKVQKDNTAGALVIDGAVLENFVTDGSVKNAAPVTVTGGGSFEIKSGEIRNNVVGYGANEEEHSQATAQQLKNTHVVNSNRTDTAGAVIISGSGSNGKISGTAKINGNKADAGAFIVTKDAEVVMDMNKATANNPIGINGNIGWHHGGAVLVENGGTFHLKNGSINNNVAWLKGGAVWATEFGTSGLVEWDQYPNTMKSVNDNHYKKGGNFVMDGGELDGNFSFVRAGAIEVESNGVQLNSGTISNNMCKSLGGAIYVEGDSPIYTYTLNIRNGYIHHNTAVDSEKDDDLDKKLLNGQLTEGDAYANGSRHSDGDWSYWGMKQSGDGGGVWLCSMGGTSVFTSNNKTGNEKAQVVIHSNTASKKYDTAADNGWGNDFYISRRYGSALVQNLLGTWKDDAGNDVVTNDANGRIIKGPKGMENTDKTAVGTGIEIYGNRSRNGGGIAANGTIILGEASDVYRYEAELDITKEWDPSLEQKEVTIELHYHDDANNNGEVDEGETIFKIQNESRLDSTSNADDESEYYEIKLGGNNTADTITGNEVIYRTGKNSAKAFIPATAKDPSGNLVELYKIRNKQGDAYILTDNIGETHIDTTNEKHLEALFTYLKTKGSENVPLSVDWNIVFKEVPANKYIFVEEDPDQPTATAKVTNSVQLVNPDDGSNVPQGSFSVNLNTVKFGQTLSNSPRSKDFEINKTDNKGVTINKEASFRLYQAEWVSEGEHWKIADVTKYDTFTVDPETGKLELKNLKYEYTYLLFEENAPAGYKRAVKPWLVQLDNEGNVTVRKLRDDRAHYVRSTRSGVDSVTDSYNYLKLSASDLSDIEWPNGWYNSNGYGGIPVDKLKNEPDIPREIYKVDGQTLPRNSNGEYVKPSEAQLNNVKFLNGAEFTVYEASVRENPNGIGLIYTIEDINLGEGDTPLVVRSEKIGDKNGVIRFPVSINPTDEKTERYFLLVETTAPDGYAPNAAFGLRLNRNGTTQNIDNSVINGQTIVYTLSPTATIGNISVGQEIECGEFDVMPVQAVPNFPELVKVDENGLAVTGSSAQFVITKADSDNNGWYILEGRNWDHTLTQASAKAFTGDSNGTAKTATSDPNTGRISISDLPQGNYLLFETSAPNGFRRTTSPWLIQVTNNGNGLTRNVYALNSKYVDKAKMKGSGSTITEQTIAETDQSANQRWWPDNWFDKEQSVQKLANQPKYLTKVDIEGAEGDSPTVLKGATFKMYSVHKDNAGPVWYYCKGIDWSKAQDKDKRQYDLSTDDNGIIQLPSEVTASEGKYLLFEETHPLAYKQPTKPWLVEVDANGDIKVKSIEDSVTDGDGSETIVNTKWWKIDSFKERSWSSTYRIPNELDTVTRKARKVWVDKDGKTTNPPNNVSRVVVHLYKIVNGERTLVGEKEITSSNWNETVVFDDLPKYAIIDNGTEEIAYEEEITYEIIEESVDGYVPSYDVSGDTTTISNKPFTGGKVKLTVDKKWASLNGEPESIKPTSIKFDIYCDLNEEDKPVLYTENIEISASNNWITSVRDLPMYAADGRKLKYWVKEQSVEGFAPVTVYSEASDTQNDNEKNYEYTGYTWDNPSVGNSQWIGEKLHRIVKQDGEDEIVYCLNVQYGAPETEINKGTKYKRVEVTKANAGTVLKQYMHENDYNLTDGTTSGRTYSIGYWNNGDYSKLYYTLLKLAYYGYGGKDNSWIGTSNLNPNLVRHLTQFAVYEYTDFYYSNTSFNYTIKKSKSTPRWGRHSGPFGLINDHSTTGKNQRIYNQSNLESYYLALLNKIESTTNSQVDSLGLKLYIYVPVEANNPKTGRKYQNLIGVETAEVNMYATINNQVKYEDITLYKYGVKTYDENEERTAIAGVKFTLYEPATAANGGKSVAGIDELVKIKNDDLTTGSGANAGKVTINGLLPGRTYYLVEKKAGNEYLKLTKPIKFKLSNKKTDTVTPAEKFDWNESMDNADEEIVLAYGASIATELKVANKKIYDLPSAGGMGTYWFMIIGAMMMGFALTAAFTKMDLLALFRR